MKRIVMMLLVSLMVCSALFIEPFVSLATKADLSGEVLNFAPTVDFELKEKKKVDVIVDVGTTNMSMDEVNSLVNAQLRPKLQEAGYDFKLHVEKSSEGLTKYYYFAAKDASDQNNTALYSYDFLTNQFKKEYETGYVHFDSTLDPVTSLIFSSNRAFIGDKSLVPEINFNRQGYQLLTSYSASTTKILPNRTAVSSYVFHNAWGNQLHNYAQANADDILRNIREGLPIQMASSSKSYSFYAGHPLYSDRTSLVYTDGTWFNSKYHVKNLMDYFFGSAAEPNIFQTNDVAGTQILSYSKATGEVIFSRPVYTFSDGSIAARELMLYNPKTGKISAFSANPNLVRGHQVYANFLDGTNLIYSDHSTNFKPVFLSDYRDPSSKISLDFLTKQQIDPSFVYGNVGDYIIMKQQFIDKYFFVNVHTEEIIPIFNDSNSATPMTFPKLPDWYTAQTRYITNILEDIPYRSDAEKYYIRLDEADILHLRNSKNLAKTVNAFSKQQINYIAIGNQHNRSVASKIQSALSQESMHYDIAQLAQSLNQIGAYITERKEVDLHILVAQSGQAKAAIESSVVNLVQQLREENIIVKPHYIYGTASSKLQEMSNQIAWNPDKNQYLLFLNTATMNELSDQAYLEGTAATLSSNYAHYMQIGSSSNRTIAESIIKLNESRGKFYSGTNYSSYYADMKQYIEDTALKNPKRVKDVLVLQHDPATNEYSAEINVNLYYDDYETDRKRNERFKTTQDPTIYENHNGLMDGIGQYLEAPTTRFTKVGLYEMTMQAQDEPISNPAFSEYWKWSQDSLSLLRLYVHRAPVAKFSAVVRPNRTVAITDYSYDLDRYSRINRGIVEWEWKWKKLDDPDWTAGQLTQLANNTDYFIALRVKDIDGAWSNEYIQFVTTNPYNQPPVALFKIEPATVSHRANATITDLSYDPDGDAIVKREWVAKKDGQVIWSKEQQPTKAQLQAAASKPLGSYEISLRVTDALGEVSEWHTEWLEVVNYPPLANFEDLVETDRDSLNKLMNTTVEPDQDGDAVSYKWTMQFKDKTYNLGTSKHPQFTIKNYGLGKAAIGEWHVTLQTSDSLGASSKLTKAFNVINHAPTAEITSSPPFAYIDETYSFTSNDDDRDSEDKSSLKSYWKLTAPSGKVRMYYQKNLTSMTFDEKGPHLMEHWAEDQLGAVSETVSVSFNVLNKRPVADFERTPITTYRGIDITFKSLGTDYDGWLEAYRYELLREGSTPLTLSTDAEFTRSFSSIGTYDIQHTVTDNDGASDSITKKIYIVNRAPRAEVLDPSGTTAATATEYNTLTPTIRWRMTDADGDQQVQYQLQLKSENGNELRTTAITTSANQSFTIPSGWLAEGPKYRVSVRVYDGYDWSSYAEDKYFFVTLNRPPVPGFKHEPSVLYEGDRVTLHHQVSDPDGDTLSVRYKVTHPDGKVQYYPSASTFYSITSSNYNSVGPSWIVVPGRYTVEQMVTDSKSDPVSLTRSFNVSELGVRGYVSHTEEWEQNRLSYNEKYPKNKRDELTFWAGERFVLDADTTNTGSSQTKATKVDVVAQKIGKTSLSSTNKVRWSGFIGSQNADVNLQSLSDGQYEFTFTATYSNGVVKEDVVIVTIKGNWTEFYKLHQSW